MNITLGMSQVLTLSFRHAESYLEIPGAGLEFLTFHRDFIARFHRWYDSQPFADQNAVAPWTSVPPELKVARAGWNSRWEDDERRFQTNNPPFASADELGLFIELGIHNRFLHGATALIFNEPIVSMPLPSPESTFFYKIHGLVDHWWQLWEQQRGNLLWYRHDGWQEGTEEMTGRNLVGRGGWRDYHSVFASSNGIIYGVTREGDLYWYRHDGWQEGTEEMTGRNLVGRGGWRDYHSVFASSNGIIYGIG